MVVCFGWSIVRSIYIVVTGVHVPSLQHPSIARFLTKSGADVVRLGVAIYVLRRQGRSLVDLGFGTTTSAGSTSVMPGLRDLFPALYLAFGAVVAHYLVEWWFLIVMWLDGIHLHSHAMNVGFAYVGRSSMLLRSSGAILLITNAIFEESLVRAYLMTEIIQFTRKPWLALIVSVVVQASYHLYQGVLPAFSYLGLFAVFAFFYMRTGRIWPVILAHMILDAVAMFAR